MTNRQIEILKLLTESKHPVSGKVVSTVILSSLRTVRKEMSYLQSKNDYFKEKGFLIKVRYSVGYYIEVIESDKFEVYKNEVILSKKDDGSILELKNELLGILLIDNNKITIDYLVDVLFSNRTSIINALNILKTEIFKYELEIISNRQKGYSIYGKEFHKRLALMTLLRTESIHIQKHLNAFKANDSQKAEICKIVINILDKQLKLQVPYECLLLISEYIYISNVRNKNGFFLSEDNFFNEEARISKNTYLTSKKVIEVLTNEFGYSFNEMDSDCLCLLIKSYRIMETDDFRNRKHYEKMAEEALAHINQIYNIDHEFDNNDFTKRLVGHLASLHRRSKYTIPILIADSEIVISKREYGSAYELAYSSLIYLNEKFNITFNEREVVYLAPIFSFLSKRHQITNRKLNGLVLTTHGRAYGSIVKERLEMVFPMFFKKVVSIDYSVVHKIDLKEYDLVFTNIPEEVNHQQIFQLKKYTNSDTMYRMFQFINKAYQSNIFEFLEQKHIFENVSIKNLEGFWLTLENILSTEFNNNGRLMQKIIQKNKYSSFERGNNTAVIFLQETQFTETKIFIIHMKKPIIWDKEVVQIVFVICCKWESFYGLDYLNHEFRSLLRSRESTLNIIVNPTYENIKKIVEDAIILKTRNAI